MSEYKTADIKTNPEVVLLSPPYGFPPRPSIALSIFKTCLNNAGISSVTLYPMVRMAELLGLDVVQAIMKIPSRAIGEEYIFSHLTGIKKSDDIEDYIAFFRSERKDIDYISVKETLLKGMKAAEQVTEETAREIVSLSPKVLAVSSVFYQLNAALSIIRRVKELNPDIKVLMGGPNCMGKAGEAILRFSEGVDAVFFGEGDEVFAETIKALETGDSLPYGCLRREDIDGIECGKVDLPFRLTKEMNTVPIPDYSDFFPYLDNMSDEIKSGFHNDYYGSDNEPVLLIEGSRGCWWGQKHPCTFCALNGVKNIYRQKSSDVIFKEMMTQYERHNITHYEFTDNVIPTQMLEEFLPLLEQSDMKFDLFAEVKPIFSEPEVFRLKRAGFKIMQTGIETLNDHLLKLLNKGGDVANNIRFLKCLRHAGVRLYWNLLVRMPGEEKEDYEEMVALMPLLYHLPPPTGYSEIIFESQGAYVKDPERFGLTVAPKPVYRYLFGNNDEIINLFASHFDDIGEESKRLYRETQKYYDPIADMVKEWNQTYWKKGGCHLLMEDKQDYLIMTDTRSCAKMTMCFLKEPARTVCLLCDRPQKFNVLLKKMQEENGGFTEEELKDCLDYLTDSRYLVYISGQYLTLAINKSCEY